MTSAESSASKPSFFRIRSDRSRASLWLMRMVRCGDLPTIRRSHQPPRGRWLRPPPPTPPFAPRRLRPPCRKYASSSFIRATQSHRLDLDRNGAAVAGSPQGRRPEQDDLLAAECVGADVLEGVPGTGLEPVGDVAVGGVGVLIVADDRLAGRHRHAVSLGHQVRQGPPARRDRCRCRRGRARSGPSPPPRARHCRSGRRGRS